MDKKRSIVVSSFVSQEAVERKIYMIRGKKVMIDQDLANLYQVPTKVLNQAVKRNIKRFPPDFIFRLNGAPRASPGCLLAKADKAEKKEVVTNCDHLRNLRFSPQPPYAFTELGVSMLSSVLNSERAILVNVEIMRTFYRLKELLLRHKDLQHKLDELEKKYDKQFQVVFKTIKMIVDKHNDNPPKRFNL